MAQIRREARRSLGRRTGKRVSPTPPGAGGGPSSQPRAGCAITAKSSSVPAPRQSRRRQHGARLQIASRVGQVERFVAEGEVGDDVLEHRVTERAPVPERRVHDLGPSAASPGRPLLPSARSGRATPPRGRRHGRLPARAATGRARGPRAGAPPRGRAGAPTRGPPPRAPSSAPTRRPPRRRGRARPDRRRRSGYSQDCRRGHAGPSSAS